MRLHFSITDATIFSSSQCWHRLLAKLKVAVASPNLLIFNKFSTENLVGPGGTKKRKLSMCVRGNAIFRLLFSTIYFDTFFTIKAEHKVKK